MFDTKKTILQRDFQIGRPICKPAGQSVIGRLVSQFANCPDWQIGRNMHMLTSIHEIAQSYQDSLIQTNQLSKHMRLVAEYRVFALAVSSQPNLPARMQAHIAFVIMSKGSSGCTITRLLQYKQQPTASMTLAPSQLTFHIMAKASFLQQELVAAEVMHHTSV